MTSELARLIVPALRWDRAHGFRYLDGLIDDALELGVGGFFIENGPRDEVAALAGRLHGESRMPILIAARAECGAGETIEGLTRLPPFGAISSVAVVQRGGAAVPSLDAEPIRRAAQLTARELRNIGVNWALAPNCELDLARDPETGSRAASDDPAIVAAVVSEWIDACQAEAVLSTAKRFPGSGGDLRPFASAVDAGVAAIMVASPRDIDALRDTLQFSGIVVTSSLDSDASILPANESALGVAAVAAGCDIVLSPSDLNGMAAALTRAAQVGGPLARRVRGARERIDNRAGWARPNVARELSLDDVMWSRQLADSCVRYVHGAKPRIGATLEVVCRGDAAMDHFIAAVRAMHIEVTESAKPGRHERAPLVILWAPRDVRAGNVSREELDEIRALAKVGTHAGRDVAIVAFAHPRAASALATTAAVLCAWEPSKPMQEAAARMIATTRS